MADETPRRETPKIDAVFFDIGNVLLRFDPKAAAAKMAWALRRHPLKVARYFWKSGAVQDIETGKLAGEQLYARFRDDLGYKGTFAQFRALWCGQFELERRNVALLRRLIERGRKVYLLSNTNALHYDHIVKTYAFARLVDGAVLSHELGLRKPDRGIYEAALKLAGVPGERCLFIDDLPENVEGARKAGLHAIHHGKGHDLKAALADYGLL